MNAESKAARNILAHIEACYVPTHSYVDVSPTEFRHLDLRFYDNTATLLEKHGFRRLGDQEDRTLAAAPGNVLHRVMIRALVSDDGQIAAGLYHPKLKKLWMRVLLFILGKRPGKIVDLETEFSDGSFIATGNAETAFAMELPSQIEAEYWPRKTMPEQLLARHQVRVREALARVPGRACRLVRSIDEVHASQNRMNALKAAHRGEIGGVSREELQRLTPSYDSELAGRVHDEIQAQLARR